MDKNEASPANCFKAFTLVEMLVVIGIIAILASMLAPSLQKSINAAKSISCLNNLKQTGISLNLYSGENYGYYPVCNEQPYWSVLLMDYCDDNMSTMLCPADQWTEKDCLADERSISYGYNCYGLGGKAIINPLKDVIDTAKMWSIKTSQIRKPSATLSLIDSLRTSTGKGYFLGYPISSGAYAFASAPIDRHKPDFTETLFCDGHAKPEFMILLTTQDADASSYTLNINRYEFWSPIR